VGAFLVAAAAAAVEVPVGPASVSEAISIGQYRPERERARVHAPYRLAVNRAPIDYIEVVTPFRRVVLVAESRAEIGDRLFSQRQGLELLATAPSIVEMWLEVTFHPQNTYVAVPGYEMSLTDGRGRRIPPEGQERTPRYVPRVEGSTRPLPIPGGAPLGTGQTLLGGTVIARFDATRLNASGVYDVVIEEGQKELARVRADLGQMR
jgi:hypothetical protein